MANTILPPRLLLSILAAHARTLAKARQRELAWAYLNDQDNLGRFPSRVWCLCWCRGAGPTMLGADRARMLDEDEAATRLTTDMRREHGRPGCQRLGSKKMLRPLQKTWVSLGGTNMRLMRWPSKKPASAAQSKIFESGALILLLLMIPGNGCRRPKGRNCDSPALKLSLSSQK